MDFIAKSRKRKNHSLRQFAKFLGEDHQRVWSYEGECPKITKFLHFAINLRKKTGREINDFWEEVEDEITTKARD